MVSFLKESKEFRNSATLVMFSMMEVVARLLFREGVIWVGEGLTNCLVFCVKEGSPGS